MSETPLQAERAHLSALLEAIQRCVLAFYEKVGVIESIVSWQLCRTTRNLAAHDYGTDYAEIAEHFNALHSLIPPCMATPPDLPPISGLRWALF